MAIGGSTFLYDLLSTSLYGAVHIDNRLKNVFLLAPCSKKRFDMVQVLDILLPMLHVPLDAGLPLFRVGPNNADRRQHGRNELWAPWFKASIVVKTSPFKPTCSLKSVPLRSKTTHSPFSTSRRSRWACPEKICGRWSAGATNTRTNPRVSSSGSRQRVRYAKIRPCSRRRLPTGLVRRCNSSNQ